MECYFRIPSSYWNIQGIETSESKGHHHYKIKDGSGEEWEYLVDSTHSEARIRAKFLGIACFLAPAVTLFIHLPMRLFQLFSLDRARELADWEWKILHTGEENCEKGREYHWILLRRECMVIATDIVKLAAQPLALIAKIFVALYGIYDPVRGRHYYIGIELLLSVQLRDNYESISAFELFAHYSANCTLSLTAIMRFCHYNEKHPFSESSIKHQVSKLSNRIRFMREIDPEFLPQETLARLNAWVEKNPDQTERIAQFNRALGQSEIYGGFRKDLETLLEAY